MPLQAFFPLVTYPDPVSETVLSSPVAMARLLGASMHACAVNVDVPPVSNMFSGFLLNVPDMIREAEALSRQRGDALLQSVSEQAAAEGVEIDTSTLAAAPALLGDVAAARARYFDLVLLGWEADTPNAAMLAEAIVFGAGRPALLLPAAVAPGDVGHVAIAWDGSRAAARAVSDAHHLLARATRVSVLTAVDEKPIADTGAGERLAETLRRRGLDAAVVAIPAENVPIGLSLQHHAMKRGAGILVMGAYGHSRLREFVLGGATAGVLADLRMPVLMAH